MSSLTNQPTSSAATVERRFYRRVSPRTPIFVALHAERSAASLLLNVSENGLLVSAPTALKCNHVTRLSIALHGLPKPVQVTVRVAWSNEAANLAGIQLLDLTEHDRQQIRKWAAIEIVQSSQPDSDVLPPAVPFFPVSTPGSYAAPASSSDDTSSTALSRMSATPSPLAVRERLASIVSSRPVRAALVAVAGFALTVLLIKAATLTPSASSRESHDEDASTTPFAAASAPETSGTLENSGAPEITSVAPGNPPSSPQNELSSPAISSANTKTSSTRSSNESPQQIAPATAFPSFAPVAPRLTPAASSANAPVPPALDALAASSTAPPITSLVAPLPTPDPPAPKSTLANASRPNDLVVSPGRPPLARNSAALQPSTPRIIQMDAPRVQTLEVHLPSNYQAPFFSLPGERVLETPALTMHIQRSVHMTPAHSWPFNHHKKVVVGELVSRIDPPSAVIPANAAATVRVRATISPEGRIASINQILGPPNLVPSVAKALHEWRYQPTLVDNKPAETQCYVTFQFHTPASRTAKR